MLRTWCFALMLIAANATVSHAEEILICKNKQTERSTFTYVSNENHSQCRTFGKVAWTPTGKAQPTASVPADIPEQYESKTSGVQSATLRRRSDAKVPRSASQSAAGSLPKE